MDRLEQIKNTITANGMREWTDEMVSQAMREYAEFKARKPLGIQEARSLVNQMLAEKITFSRFVELINEGGKR